MTTSKKTANKGAGKPKQVHVTHSKKDDEWKVTVTGNQKASFVSPLKENAREKGIEIAKKLEAELSVHRKDGVIKEKNSYGNDPNPPKDKDGKK